MIDYRKGKIEKKLFICFDKAVDFLSRAAEWASEHRIAYVGILVTIFAVFLIGEHAYMHRTKELIVLTNMNPGRMTATYTTTEYELCKFLDSVDIGYEEGIDRINFKPDDRLYDGMEIIIDEPIELELSTKDETYTYSAVPPFTLGEAISALKIDLGELDRVERIFDEKSAHETSLYGAELASGEDFLKTEFVKDSRVRIIRVTQEEVSEIKKIDFETVYENDKEMAFGSSEVTREGKKGEREKLWLVTKEDGKRVSKELIHNKVIKKPQKEIVHFGYKKIGDLPEGVEYVKKISHVKAISYNYSSQRYGSYGLPCHYGTIAVDKKLIPLGTKVFVENYGYAIANDVGSAIKGKKIDLYMEDFHQCVVWGAQWVDVYILS